MAKQKTYSVILETLANHTPSAADTVLLRGRIRGQGMETTLSLDTIRRVPLTIRSYPAMLAVGLYLYWDCRSEEHVLCCTIRAEKTHQSERPEATGKATGVLSDVPEASDWIEGDTTAPESNRTVSDDQTVGDQDTPAAG